MLKLQSTVAKPVGVRAEVRVAVRLSFTRARAIPLKSLVGFAAVRYRSNLSETETVWAGPKYGREFGEEATSAL
jgi:hypothetical protein